MLTKEDIIRYIIRFSIKSLSFLLIFIFVKAIIKALNLPYFNSPLWILSITLVLFVVSIFFYEFQKLELVKNGQN